MQIRSGPQQWQPPRSLPKPASPPLETPLKPTPDHQGDEPQLIEQVGRWIGKGSQGIAMTPQFLEAHPWVLDRLRLNGLTPYLEGAAVIFGGVGTLSLAAAGTKEVVDGIRHKNSAEVLVGASDIARGAYVGSFAASISFGYEPMGKGFGFASGILQTAGGLARMRHKKQPGNPIDPKVVGALEVGQGLAWAASMVGVPVSLCFVARMGLGAARTLYTHQQSWEKWTHKKGDL